MTQANAHDQPAAASRQPRAAQGAPCIGAVAVSAGRADLVLLQDQRIMLAESTGFEGLAALLRRAIDRGCTHLISLVPSDRVVCKTIATPVGSAEEIGLAMELLAEAELPARIPPTRRAWGRVSTPMSNGDGMIRGVLAGWMPDTDPSAAEDPIEAALASIAATDAGGRKSRVALPERMWLAEPVALLGLVTLNGSGGVVTWASQAAPARVSAAAIGRDGLVCRASRGRPGPAADRVALEQAESAASVVAVTQPLQSASSERQSAIAIDSSCLAQLRQRIGFGPGVAGATLDAAWLASFGVPLGAALLAHHRMNDRSLGSADRLLAMRPSPPVQRRSAVDQAAAFFAHPARATAAIGVGVALLLGVPYAAATVERIAYQRRAATLESRLHAAMGGSTSESSTDAASTPARAALASWRGSDDVQIQLSLYSAARRYHWPMTKLLSEATAALPMGADLESVQLSVGETVILRGTADNQNLVNNFVDALNKTGVFSGGVMTRAQQRADSTTGRPVEFQVSVQVERPHVAARGLEHDYADTPLAVILYGERARETTSTGASANAGTRIGPSSGSSRSDRGPGGPRDTSSGGSTAAGGGSGGASGGSPATGDAGSSDGASRRSRFERPGEQAADADPVPAPLTKEQIAALTDEQLRVEFAARRKASTRRDLSQDDSDRLKEETNMLRDELQRRRG